MTTPTTISGFSPAATRFFEDLEDQNTREFWLAHKHVFEGEVREPMAALLDSLPEQYQPFKVFRTNRDVRFSADKSPYKTMHGAAHGVPGAVYYLHLDASGLMVACGSYMMQPEELERYRQAVAAHSSGEELSEILAALRRRRSLKLSPGGVEPLKTAPRGFPRDHPRADLLRQKGLIAMRTRGPSELQNGARLRTFVVETFEMCADLTEWLRRYVGLQPTK
ncbi:MAG TPA: DUF2461 domain-containing protein [Propionibacteriaceae bacterium]|nr:DUF2461 domain-containing protein [Propionibacteriaceae bacterium]